MAQSTFEAWQEKVVEGLFLIAADKSAQQAQAAEMAKRLSAFTQQDFSSYRRRAGARRGRKRS
jgi:hypothetical protein